MSAEKANSKYFTQQEGGRFLYSDVGGNATNVLEPGYYSLQAAPGVGRFLQKEQAPESDRVTFPSGGPFQEVVNDLECFWSPETRKAFDRYGLLHRRGILLHGDPGTGKSVLCRVIAEHVVKNGGIVFWDPHPLELFRHIQDIQTRLSPPPTGPDILVIFEEFEEWLNGGESLLLSLLDGQRSLNGAVYLATTNYIKDIPERFRDRPSRFARIINMPAPSEKERYEFLRSRIHEDDMKKIGDEGLQRLAEKTNGFTIDHLKELIACQFCMNVPEDEAIERLKNAKDLKAGIR